MHADAGFYKISEGSKEPDADLLQSLKSLSLVCTAKQSSEGRPSDSLTQWKTERT